MLYGYFSIWYHYHPHASNSIVSVSTMHNTVFVIREPKCCHETKITLVSGSSWRWEKKKTKKKLFWQRNQSSINFIWFSFVVPLSLSIYHRLGSCVNLILIVLVCNTENNTHDVIVWSTFKAHWMRISRITRIPCT